MNKSIVICALLFSTFILFAQDDKKESIFRAAVILGFNGTQVDGDDLGGYRKFGLNAGGAAFVMLPKNFSVNFEILYSQKGSKKTNNQLFIEAPSKLSLDYVDVPLIFNYHDKDSKGKDIAIFGLGFVFNSLVRYKVEDEYGVLDLENPYHRFGLEAAANIIFKFAKRFGINLRFTYSITNIAKEPILISNLKNGGQRNNIFSLRGMYFF